MRRTPRVLGLWIYDLTDARREASIDYTTTRGKFQDAEGRVDGLD
jgi:hypothetical protein